MTGYAPSDIEDLKRAFLPRLASIEGGGLQAVIRADGSRPACLVRGNRIVEDSAPDSLWTDLLCDPQREAGIEAVLGCVGRIDTDHPLRPFTGTGWLAGPDLMFANRHVVELIVEFCAPGGPRLQGEFNPRIDFGHEHDASSLCGNSGSLVMGLDALGAVAAIHHGGVWHEDPLDFAHGMEAVMEEPGLAGLADGGLGALCAAEGVERRAF